MPSTAACDPRALKHMLDVPPEEGRVGRGVGRSKGPSEGQEGLSA